jgi:hypothetical protein
MNLTSSRTRLELLTRTLLLQWDETKNYWRDAKSSDFDRVYMQELGARVEKAGTIIEKLDHVLSRVRQDCE